MLPRPRLARWLSPVLRRSTSYYAKAPPVSFVSQLPSPPSIRRPLLFAALLGSSSVLLAVGLTNTDTATRLSQVSHASWRFNRSVSDADLARARRTELIAQIKGTLQELQRAVGGEIRGPIMLAENWLRKSEGQMTAIGLIALNSVVFLGWRFKGLQNFMSRRFLHNPLSPRVLTLLSATFSHKSLLHFAFNSIALYSIGGACADWLARPSRSREEGVTLLRSTSRYEFLAFFLCAGVMASLMSHIWSIKVLLPRIARAASAGTVATKAILPSLGASGAIYGCLSITALAYPTASVSLIFLPFVPIPIMTAYYGMLLVDLVGLLRGWALFDHAAHLGGALAGVLYYWYGAELFDQLRESMDKDGRSSSSDGGISSRRRVRERDA